MYCLGIRQKQQPSYKSEHLKIWTLITPRKKSLEHEGSTVQEECQLETGYQRNTKDCQRLPELGDVWNTLLLIL